MGTTTPQAPASSTRLKFSALFHGIRTIGAVLLAAMTANIWARVRISIGLCSVSTTSQSNPRRLTYSAASGEGRDSQVPIDGSPAASRRRTWFARTVALLRLLPGLDAASHIGHARPLQLFFGLDLVGIDLNAQTGAVGDGDHAVDWLDRLLPEELEQLVPLHEVLDHRGEQLRHGHGQMRVRRHGVAVGDDRDVVGRSQGADLHHLRETARPERIGLQDIGRPGVKERLLAPTGVLVLASGN